MRSSEKLFEILTWQQLGYHVKPCGLVNTRGFFDHLLSLIDHMEGEGFLRPAHRQMLLVEQEAGVLLKRLLRYRPERIDKWAGLSR